jgi:hypothetical protein
MRRGRACLYLCSWLPVPVGVVVVAEASANARAMVLRMLVAAMSAVSCVAAVRH